MTPVFKKEFLTRVAKSGNNNPWQPWGWNAVWILAQGIESAQSFDPVEVAKRFRSMPSVQTIFGPAPLGGGKLFGTGVNSIFCPPQQIVKVKDGKPKFVKWVSTPLP